MTVTKDKTTSPCDGDVGNHLGNRFGLESHGPKIVAFDAFNYDARQASSVP